MWQARWPAWVAIGALAVVLLWTYAPVYTQDYLFTDDYHFALHGPPADYFLSGGRPLQGLLYHLMPRHTASPAARILRLVATLALVALGIALFRQLAGLVPASAPRLLVVGSVLALPAFQVSVGWLALWPSTIAALLGGCAAQLMLGSSERLVPADQTRRRWWPTGYSILRLAAAAGMNIVALCIYQPAAMWYWTVVLVAVLSTDLSAPCERRRLAVAVLGGCLHMLLYFALIKGLQYWCDVTPVARGALSSDVLGKLGWFVSKPLRNSLNAWNVFKPRWFGYLAAAALVAGAHITARSYLARLRSQGVSPRRAYGWLVLQTSLIVALVGLSYLPNLVVVESWASYRSAVALSGSVTLLGLAAAMAVARHAAGSLSGRLIARVLAGTTCLALLAIARWNIVETMIVPQQHERADLLAALDERLQGDIRHIHLIQPEAGQFSPYSEQDEFGLATTATDFGARAMLALAIRERPTQQQIELSLGRAPRNPHDSATLNIDMRTGAARRTSHLR